MANVKALQKRIKRRLIGREHTFFAVTLPGLESLCRQELAALPLDNQKLQIEKGGVLFQARLHDAYAANLHLRTASRILMRIGQFRAANFRQLEKQLRAFPWELFLFQQQPFDLNVTSRRSRLIHTAAIAQRFEQAITARLSTQPGLPVPANTRPSALKIAVRCVADLFTLSLDSSGDPLYKRGLKTYGGMAPLRETFAAAMLAMAGFSRHSILAGPMCGSGTFTLEAALVASRIPPGWYRDFAFMDWPCYRPGRWKYLRKLAGSRIDIPQAPGIFASDHDPLAVASLQTALIRIDLDPAVHLQTGDFFTVAPPHDGAVPGVVVLNPPYGLRLKIKDSLERQYSRIGSRLTDTYPGWNLAMILPRKDLGDQLPFRISTLPFQHSGLHLTLATGKIE